MDEIIDRDTFKALSSETRVKVIKLLNKRRMTATELAGQLKLRVPTIIEHLKRMEGAGLVTKDDQRKWHYYDLTPKGLTLVGESSMVGPQPRNIVILLVVALLSLTMVVYSLYGFPRPFAESGQQIVGDSTDAGAVVARSPFAGAQVSTPTPQQVVIATPSATPKIAASSLQLKDSLFYTGGVIFLVALIGLFWAIKISKR